MHDHVRCRYGSERLNCALQYCSPVAKVNWPPHKSLWPCQPCLGYLAFLHAGTLWPLRGEDLVEETWGPVSTWEGHLAAQCRDRPRQSWPYPGTKRYPVEKMLVSLGDRNHLKRLESRIWILLVQSSIFETNDLMFVCRASTRSWVARVVWLWICVISLACELHTCSILSRNLRCQALPFSPTSTPEVDANRLAHAIPAVAGCPRQGGTVTFVNAWLSFSNPITDWQDLDSCMVHSPQAKFNWEMGDLVEGFSLTDSYHIWAGVRVC